MRASLRLAHASASRPPCKRKLNLDANVGDHCSWQSLGVSPRELNLGLTLLTGQSFLWKQTQPQEFTGVVGSHLVSLKQIQDDILFLVHNVDHPESKHNARKVKVVLEDYFTLRTQLRPLWDKFSAVDERFAAVSPFLEGARLLRQDPVECVFQFICSSNNHIQRITQMVDYLASRGCWLGKIHGHDFYTFPTLEQLSLVTEKQLRDAGFGYRAKYVTGAVELLRSREGGGNQWLMSLRNVPSEEARASLCTLPGIGPKVAACVALFSLDKHDAIPVDTHVWQIAVRYMNPELGTQRLSAKLHQTVAQEFVSRFGEYAGWAHTVLFIAELASQQNRLPAHLRLETKESKKQKRKR